MFFELFKTAKPIIGMLHLKGESRDAILKQAITEAKIYAECGVDAMLVEDYFGDGTDVENVLAHLSKEQPHYILGVNVLNNFEKSYDLALQYGLKFMQVDSICGHLEADAEKAYFDMIDGYRKKGKVLVIGGVRFKYQPVLSNRSVKDDMEIGMKHCDAMAVTGAGTGLDTGTEKIKLFRELVGDFPLVVAAGMTRETIKEKLSIADAAIVGSTFKEGHKDLGDVSAGNVTEFMNEVRSCFR